MELVGTLAPKSFSRHLVNRQQKRKQNRRSMILALMLTPMVDMFSLLVIFLLQTFSASPELLVTKGVRLPNAISGRELKDSPVLSVSEEGLYLDQKMIGPVADLLKNPTPLMEKLADLREKWMKAHPTESFRGEITLQADRGIPSTTISQLMAMLPSQNYGSIQLAVISGGG